MTVRLHAPAESGETLCVPDRKDWASLARSNSAALSRIAGVVGGLEFADWRSRCRSAAIRLAMEYGRRFSTSPASTDADAPLVVTGHQPELFHPGVWIKSFATCGLARQLGGAGLHVLTDNDTLKRPTISVPAGSPSAPLVAQTPLDEWAGEVPFEERSVLAEKSFHRFDERVMELLAKYPFTPVVEDVWRVVRSIGRLSLPLGERLAAGRRRLEKDWGAGNLEVPLSHLCRDADSFGRYAADLVVHLPEFAEIHNTELLAFRLKNKIRSRHHPVPELDRDGDWLEAPFWIWKSDDPRRRRPFVRVFPGGLALRAEQEIVLETAVSKEDPSGALAERLVNLPSGWKLRPRALLTTGFLRLGLSDLFLHGIGGGIYDELTDSIILDFWKIKPPAYAVATATLRLPNVPSPAASARKLATFELLQRDLEWNPDRHLDDVLREQESVSSWIERKHDLMVFDESSRQSRRERFHQFRRVNEQLRPYVDREREDVHSRIRKAEQELAAQSLMGSREFAYCLHPAETLQSVMLPMLDPA
jgi:hypothetical protein